MRNALRIPQTHFPHILHLAEVVAVACRVAGCRGEEEARGGPAEEHCDAGAEDAEEHDPLVVHGWTSMWVVLNECSSCLLAMFPVKRSVWAMQLDRRIETGA